MTRAIIFGLGVFMAALFFANIAAGIVASSYGVASHQTNNAGE